MPQDQHPLKPNLVAHADWSARPQKCWLATASLQKNGRYLAEAPQLVGSATTILSRLIKQASGPGLVIVGFDFPIGLPAQYARRAGISHFLSALPQFGHGLWSRFYDVAHTASEVNLYRPFYPHRPGRSKQQHLLDGLGLNAIQDLRRRCDLARPGRRAAAPLFWTMGAQQVGKAAIHGWQSVLVPALKAADIDVAIWPFSGSFYALYHPQRIIIAETYPAECYDHLGLDFARQAGRASGKRHQHSRQQQATALINWAQNAHVELTPVLRARIAQGFGPQADGEDPFDATVGLFGLLNVILGHRSPGNPTDSAITRVEGWILGQQA